MNSATEAADANQAKKYWKVLGSGANTAAIVYYFSMPLHHFTAGCIAAINGKFPVHN